MTDGTARSVPPWSRRRGRALLLALAILAVDQWTKAWIERTLPVGGVREVIPGLFNLTHIRNDGVAFGLLAAHDGPWKAWLLAALAMVAIGVVIALLRGTPDSQPVSVAALGLVLGGAVGNLLDRVMSGAVTDFLDFYRGGYHWHNFNVADAAISVGVALLLLDSLVLSRRGRRPERASP